MAKRIQPKAQRNFPEFLASCPSACHVPEAMAAHLVSAGYAELDESKQWKLRPGGKYYLVRNSSSLLAFAIDSANLADKGMRIIASHTDSPTFKIKPGPCTITPARYLRLNVEAYGGAILSSWFDRPLSLAGRVALKGEKPFQPTVRLIDCKRALAVIPNLAIHFNRSVNEGYAYNKQIDMQPLFGLNAGGDDDDCIPALIAEELGVSRDNVLEYELYLYDCTPGSVLGRDGELFLAAKWDNLSMVYAGVRGMVESQGFGGLRMLVAFDNEEVGSRTMQGADSSFLPGIIRRICLGLGMDEEKTYQALARSLCISGDVAHAVHPNHADKHDPENRPVLGGGPVIKYSAGQKYVTNAVSAAVFEQVCAAARVPVQKYVNRSDLPGGSTIGPALSSMCSILTVDVGIPILSMHSVQELGALADVEMTATAFACFYDLDS